MRRASTGAVAVLAVAALTGAGADARRLSEEPIVTTIAAITDAPETYKNRSVAVAGRFRGRAQPESASLLPPLDRGRWDFVLQSPQGAIWVSGLRPRGRSFDLDPLSTVDARVGRWLQVTGRVHVTADGQRNCKPVSHCTQIWIRATAIQAATSWEETNIVVPRVAGPPPQVVFNDPIVEETNVPRSTAVRVQFSEDMDAATFEGRVRVSYVPRADRVTPAAPRFTTTYNDGNKALEVRFAAPLERFQEVRVELLDGIAARDGQKLAPWAFTFTTGS